MLESVTKREKFLEGHAKVLGPFLNEVLLGNSVVDKAASDLAKSVADSSPLFLTMGNDDWQLIDRRADVPVYGSVKKNIYSKLVNRGVAHIQANLITFSSRLFHPLVSPVLTTTVFRSKNSYHGKLADFMHKVIDRSLPTRNRVWEARRRPSYKHPANPAKRCKMDKTYKDNHCMACEENKRGIYKEDTDHIFTACPSYRHISDAWRSRFLN